MTGSPNAQGAMALIIKANHYGIVTGSVANPLVSLVGNLAGVQPMALFAAAAPAPAPITLTAEQTADINAAVAKTAQAAADTPAAAGGTPTGGNTLADDLNAAAGALQLGAEVVADVETLEQGAHATLHWWGWTLDLTHDAAQALERLLNNDFGKVVQLLEKFVVSAPLAAAAAIIEVATDALAGWVQSEDDGDGVEINFYLWIAPDVSPREAAHPAELTEAAE